MGYKRILMEQSDNEYDDDSIPTRGESFSMGLQTGWDQVIRIFPVCLIILILLMWWMC